ncbi:hypothetical protein ASG87_01330 [Frateuria sp. Soil773]|uniref:hypothetical protein n=1 Tax=Frateuria sp. Soil773 TaxID=1736407 RepID=UPI0006FBAAD7|nr:hypothetical protein [Frateuria sp. Soil773]KRE90806.1 hypothetical protein ASG87_01330 [Frateuria sp. Soil773]
MATAFAGPAFAQQQLNTGLGSTWPTDTPDVSLAPGFHAYVWVKSGVKYVQINDAAGNVLVAVATANGIFLPLPMGRSAKLLQTPQDGTTATGGAAGVAIYQDGSVQITAMPQDDGAMVFKAEATCTNPVECTTHVN